MAVACAGVLALETTKFTSALPVSEAGTVGLGLKGSSSIPHRVPHYSPFLDFANSYGIQNSLRVWGLGVCKGSTRAGIGM